MTGYGKVLGACALAVMATGCGSSATHEAGGFVDAGGGGQKADAGQSAQDGAGTEPVDGSSMSFGDVMSVEGGGGCDAPDMLIVLDHTESMSQTPGGMRPPNTPAGHAETKWVLATSAVAQITAPPIDQTLRFGLELFPLDPETVDAGAGQGECVTLSQLLGGTHATNRSCQPAEIPVMPDLGTGSTIATLLDPETRRLCVSTPIALALQGAASTLTSIASPGRKQYVVLITDGGETCGGDVVAATQALAASGVKTYVVGFGGLDGGSGGVNVKLLNDVACAGLTATGFPAPCKGSGSAYVATTPDGPPVFFSAEDGASLSSALGMITGDSCCGCAQ